MKNSSVKIFVLLSLTISFAFANAQKNSVNVFKVKRPSASFTSMEGVQVDALYQDNPNYAVTLCGKSGEYFYAKNGYLFSLPLNELLDCGFKLVPVDTNVEVISFKVSKSGKKVIYKEYDFIGDSIPKRLMPEIFTPSEKCYVEFIKGKIKSRNIIKSLTPIMFEFQ